MSNPVLVEVIRGNSVESRHRGAIAIVDETGATVHAIGDVSASVFPRSAVKALQAIPLIESGAAEALDFDEAELALACSSHNGEQIHANTARGMLRKAGLDESALLCGVQWPKHMQDQFELVKTDQSPCPLHNNCSGKHAGFLAMAKTLGIPTENYVDYDHPVQRELRQVVEEMTGGILGHDNCGLDGCSIPTYAIELQKTAHAFAKFGTGAGLAPLRAEACEQLYEACVNEPYMVAGRDRFCTSVMDLFKGRAFLKTGAEGVFCASLPELGFGVALKCDDGGTRGAEAMMAGVLAGLLKLDNKEHNGLKPWLSQPLHNFSKRHVGDVRVVDDVMRQLQAPKDL
ncbi:asparaginase [Polycladidibacter hongkongensis]|uniref:asparaginase n=1 Tax=Polycladidibacter hongkongensis TaxID=1647556 RepID=UPI00082FC01D|nr:asparaginase [Pseudovibrio hongkongensis]